MSPRALPAAIAIAIASAAISLPEIARARTSPQPSVPCDYAGVRGSVLAIGDSHLVEEYGDALQSTLATRMGNWRSPARVARYAVGSSDAQDWADPSGRRLIARRSQHWCDGPSRRVRGRVGPEFRSFQRLASLTPSAVVISLGTNDLGTNCKATRQEVAMAGARDLLRQRPAAPCVWIGPPIKPRAFSHCTESDEARYRSFLRAEAVAAGCGYFDSSRCLFQARPIPPNAGDGAHFVGPQATALGNCAGEAAARELLRLGDDSQRRSRSTHVRD